MQNIILLLHDCKITLPKSAVRLKVFRPTKDVPTLISTSVQVSGAANESLANKAWSKCFTENSKKHEYKGQPRYSACQSLFNWAINQSAIDFCAIGQSNEGSATGKENPIDHVHSRESIFYLASDASSSRLKLYVLQEDVTSATKKVRAVCFDNDPFNPLTFTEDTERNQRQRNMWRRDRRISQQPDDRNDWTRIRRLPVHHDWLCRLSYHRRSQGMFGGRWHAIHKHFQKINTIKEKEPFERVHVLLWLKIIMNPQLFVNTTNGLATTDHCLNVRECPWSRNTTRDRCSSGLQQLLITTRGNINN